MEKDELAARRWFRARLAEIAKDHPELVAPEPQRRLRQHLTDEDALCHESQQADHQGGPETRTS